MTRKGVSARGETWAVGGRFGAHARAARASRAHFDGGQYEHDEMLRLHHVVVWEYCVRDKIGGATLWHRVLAKLLLLKLDPHSL